MDKIVIIEDDALILLDINLPGQDGYYLCTQNRRFSEVPILFLTGRSTAMDEKNHVLPVSASR